MRKRILIVDDSATARMIIRRCLEIAGFRDAEFMEAVHGRQALDILREERADLVFTDLNMPEMDGKAFIRRMKSSPRLNSIPVIVVSSMTNKKEEDDLRSRGVTVIIRKPFSPMAIMNAVDTIHNPSRGV